MTRTRTQMVKHQYMRGKKKKFNIVVAANVQPKVALAHKIKLVDG